MSQFFHRVVKLSKPVLRLATVVIPTTISAAVCEQQSADQQSDSIAVYLKPDSKALVEKFLKSRGISHSPADHVCVNASATKASKYVFEPIFGERAAFRLKGLLTLADGRVVGVGRLSNMVGELKDDGIEASFVINSEPTNGKPDQVSASASMNELYDLPTRLIRLPEALNLPMWKGRLPSARVENRSYSAVKATWVRIPVEQQIVLDGYLCSLRHFDKEKWVCTFDRATEIQATEDVVAPAAAAVEDTKREVGAEDEDDDQETCSVCRYLKKGPCKESFLVWDACMKSIGEEEDVTKCFQQTKAMMRCMQKHEYYDIMTAGTDFARLDEVEAMNKKLEESSESSESSVETEGK